MTFIGGVTRKIADTNTKINKIVPPNNHMVWFEWAAGAT